MRRLNPCTAHKLEEGCQRTLSCGKICNSSSALLRALPMYPPGFPPQQLAAGRFGTATQPDNDNVTQARCGGDGLRARREVLSTKSSHVGVLHHPPEKTRWWRWLLVGAVHLRLVDGFDAGATCPRREDTAYATHHGGHTPPLPSLRYALDLPSLDLRGRALRAGWAGHCPPPALDVRKRRWKGRDHTPRVP